MNMPDNNHLPVKILVIDDDEEDFLLISRYCRQIDSTNDFIMEWCPEYDKGIAAINSGEYAIAFVDFNLGVKTGLDIIREVKAQDCGQPIVLLTGAGNHELDVAVMQAGAADYLVKSELSPEKLERCIRYARCRHEFMEALRVKEQKYRGVFENTTDFIFIANAQGAFTEVNKIGETLFGYTSSEWYQMTLADIMLHAAEAPNIIQLLHESGFISGHEIALRAKNQHILDCTLSLSMGKDAQGNTYLQGIIHNITALKMAEKATLQTAKLQATEKLVRILAHEVRNPLNNIMLALDNLDTIEDESEKVYLNIVTRNSNRINKLINELLFASKPMVVASAQVPLQMVIDSSIAAAGEKLALKNVTLQQDYSMDNILIQADADKLSMAFANIIINAIESCPATGGCIQIKTSQLHDRVKVSITDNGQGIEEANVGQIFQPYFSAKGMGMGLGLSSALSIFESHGALAQVTSAPGNGTTFEFIFKKGLPLLQGASMVNAQTG